MNMTLEKAFMFSDIAMVIENDMIIHKKFNPEQYINIMLNSKIGNIGFRYFMLNTHKCNLFRFNMLNEDFVLPMPIDRKDIGHPVEFGQNIFSRKFIETIGPFLENENDTDKVERTFVNAYVKQLGPDVNTLNDSYIKVIPMKYLHQMMNDKTGLFYHIGIFSQHNPNAVWNNMLIPKEYHHLSNDKLDEDFCNQYI